LKKPVRAKCAKASLPSRRPIQQNTPWLLSSSHRKADLIDFRESSRPLPDVEKCIECLLWVDAVEKLGCVDGIGVILFPRDLRGDCADDGTSGC
jgi:hypothetical protein